MLVQNSVYRNTYLTDGVNKDFYFSFPILESSQVLVQTSLLTDTDTVTTVDPGQYTVTGVGQTTGGHISFTTAPPTGSRLALTLDMPITQLYQYAELDSFPAKSHEDALAKLTLICQQLKEQISRAVLISATSEGSAADIIASLYAARDSATASATAADLSAVSAEASATSAETAATDAAAAAAVAVAAATPGATTPTAGAVPIADGTGKLDAGWLPSMTYNVEEIITVSGPWVSPIDGVLLAIPIGPGGGGGKGAYAEGSATHGGLGGQQGGTTSFGDASAEGGSGGAGAGAGVSQGDGTGGGGGAPGKVRPVLVKVTKGQVINVVIGAGGLGATGQTGVAYMGGDGYGPEAGIGGNVCPGQGAVGAQSGNRGGGEPGPGGAGGSNGTGYGGGGGGGAGQEGSRNNLLTPGGRGVDGGTDGGSTTATTPSATTAGDGGNGGPGAVILRYFDPAVAA